MSKLIFVKDNHKVTKRELIEVIEHLCEKLGLEFNDITMRPTMDDNAYSFSLAGQLAQLQTRLDNMEISRKSVAQNTAAPAPMVTRVEFELLLEHLGLGVTNYHGTFVDTKENIEAINNGTFEIKSTASKEQPKS